MAEANYNLLSLNKSQGGFHVSEVFTSSETYINGYNDFLCLRLPFMVYAYILFFTLIYKAFFLVLYLFDYILDTYMLLRALARYSISLLFHTANKLACRRGIFFSWLQRKTRFLHKVQT